MITARILPSEEWSKLAEIFAQNGSKLPETEFARIGVEEEDGKIVSFLAMQLALHAEPLWQHPDYRGRVSFKRLLHMMELEFEGEKDFAYYVFSPNEQIARMAELAGLKLLPWKVWKKER